MRIAFLTVTLAAILATACATERIVAVPHTLAFREPFRGDELRRLRLLVELPRVDALHAAAYSFVETLRRAEIFSAVSLLPDPSHQDDLVLSWFSLQPRTPLDERGFQCGKSYVLLATFGLIPQVCSERFILSFVLHSPIIKSPAKPIMEEYERKRIVGLVAIPMNASPRWQHGRAYEEFVASIFLTRKSSIIALTRHR